MTFNPEIHHRRSIRLQNYDYSQNGAYFVTICVNKKLELLGNIQNGAMISNDAGLMVSNLWQKLAEKFDGVFIDEFCVMPNHFHGILVIDRNNNPDKSGRDKSGRDKSRPYDGENATLGEIIRWFKGRTTYEIRRLPSCTGDIHDAHIHDNQNMFDPMFSWLRNYHERVIRNESDLENIRKYIVNNPANWENDENYSHVGATFMTPQINTENAF
jgi:REP element-mobilizing transposase RayT